MKLIRGTWYIRAKPLLDYVAGVILAVLLLPIIVVTCLVVKLTSAGPAFYSQTRLGRLGQPFRIIKFRSMTQHAERNSGAVWAGRNDSRVTPVGRFLRITHLDELPQLLNVLRGDMSLVGPRPERPEFITVLEKTVPHYRLRMLPKPGVTGLAQVYLPPDTDVASVQSKVVYDLYYIRHLSFWLDLRILIATPLQAMGLPCKIVRKCLLLPTAAQIEAESIPAELSPPPKTVVPPPEESYVISDSKFGSEMAV